MEKFVARYRPLVTGVLSGFDRLVFRFRGSLLPLIQRGGVYFFLEATSVRLLDFKKFVLATTERVKQASLAEARKLDRPIRYLESSATDKEKLARQLLAEHPVEQGLICVLTAVEPCMTFEYHRSQDCAERGLSVVDRGRRLRALRLGDRDDVALLEAVARGEVAVAGFRNRDIRRLLDPAAANASPRDLRRLSAKISRRLRLLRVHGIIRRIPQTHRYRLTTRGELLFATRGANVKQLLAKVA